MSFEEIVKKIKETNSFALVAHASPDGDAVGSTLAMALSLRSLGKKVTILSKEFTPNYLSYLPLQEEYGTVSSLCEEIQVLICLDCGNKDRLSMEREGFEEIFKINMDHHVSNENYGDLNYVDSLSASTAEIVFEVITALGVNLDEDMAKCLYTGIVSDTGSFQYPSTTAKTLNIAAHLLETGFNFSAIQRALFSTTPFKRVKLLGRALMTLENHLDGFVSTMYLESEDFNILALSDRDSGNIVNYGLEPLECDVSIMFKEADGALRVSVRTKEYIDASKLCGKFGGGGHVRAAGCNMEGITLADAKKVFLEEIERMRA